MVHSKEGSSGAGGDANLIVDVLNVVVYSFLEMMTCSAICFLVYPRAMCRSTSISRRIGCHEFPANGTHLVACCCQHTLCSLAINSTSTYLAS